MQEARAAGCRTSAEADRYFENKRRREAEESSHRGKDSSQLGAGGQGPSSMHASSGLANDLDVMGFNGSELLSDNVSPSPDFVSYFSVLYETSYYYS